MTNPSNLAQLMRLADEIEAELKKLGLWSTAAVTRGPVTSAFGADSMTFEEWLQLVFLPNLRDAARTGAVPKHSSVATAAVRNLDGVDGSGHLIDLLAQVDHAIDAV